MNYRGKNDDQVVPGYENKKVFPGWRYGLGQVIQAVKKNENNGYSNKPQGKDEHRKKGIDEKFYFALKEQFRDQIIVHCHGYKIAGNNQKPCQCQPYLNVIIPVAEDKKHQKGSNDPVDRVPNPMVF